MHVALDRDDNDRHAVYRLRYEVFTKEGGDERYADHERQFFIDQDDGPQSRLVIAWDDDGQAIGTMRLTVLREHAFIANDCYGFEVLADLLSMNLEELRQRVIRGDRSVIASASRGQGVLEHLQNAGEEYAASRGCDILVGSYRTDADERARRAWNKQGWLEYPFIGNYNGYVAKLIYKQLKHRV